jgi:acetyl-CoA synthetase (ADP-forming)
MELIQEALKKGQKVLSEYESKNLLKSYGIPVVREVFVKDVEDAIRAARGIGYPVVLKVCSPEVAHKTERSLLELNLRDDKELIESFGRLQDRSQIKEGGYLVQEWVKGNRELVMGMIRDPQFGPCVMFGLGGIFTEIFQDVTFRIAPVKKRETLEMFKEIKSYKLLGSIRGMKPVNWDVLSSSLIALGEIGLDHEAIQEIDVNPLIICDGDPVAVDALVVLKATSAKD